jgi:hypothetical protein
MPPDKSSEPVAKRAGRLALLTASSLILGIAAVAVLEPTTTGGTVFVVAVCVLLVNAGGVLLTGLGRRRDSR